MGNRYTCFSRSGNSYSAEYVRNFTVQAEITLVAQVRTYLMVMHGSPLILGTTYSDDNMHVVIHSDQDSGNEDT